jgi:serine/threonine protein phosphatase 1
MSLTYAIPDLHGRVDLLDHACSRILLHSKGQNSLVVALGDYVDRGPASRQVLDSLINWRFPSLQLIALQGNHEAMMWQACNRLSDPEWWIKNGGTQTLASYGAAPSLVEVRKFVPHGHLTWISARPLLHADAHRVFVHAGVDPKVPLGRQDDRTLLWKRYPTGSQGGHGKRHVVHGHTPDAAAPIVCRGRTNLDGMAWKTGRLVIGVFEDDRPGGAVDYLEVMGEPS